MTESPSRDDVIELLNKLGSDRDEEVLEAAREIHGRIAAAGMTWEDLLMPEGGIADADEDDDDYDAAADDDDDDDGDDDADDDDDDDDGDDSEDDDDGDDDAAGDDDDTGTGDEEVSDPADKTARPAGKKGAKQAESLALIDKILALSGISADLREEMKDLKTDIAEGELQTRDHRYLTAVHKRLSKRR